MGFNLIGRELTLPVCKTKTKTESKRIDIIHIVNCCEKQPEKTNAIDYVADIIHNWYSLQMQQSYRCMNAEQANIITGIKSSILSPECQITNKSARLAATTIPTEIVHL